MLPTVRKIVRYVSSNLDEHLTLNKLAHLARLSPSRMCCLFKGEMRVSPGLYIRDLRVKKARELLETTSLSVKEIRLRVGMSDESHFTRYFKKAFGETPSRHRAKAHYSDPSYAATEEEIDKNRKIGHKQ
jgi:transcriptional regulator GlxA family with amidase domain